MFNESKYEFNSYITFDCERKSKKQCDVITVYFNVYCSRQKALYCRLDLVAKKAVCCYQCLRQQSYGTI